MHIHILGIYPSLLDPYFSQSLLGRARDKGLVQFTYHQLRDSSTTKYQNVDDAPYGGGAGMVMLPEVVCRAVRDIKSKNKIDRVIFPSPAGHLLTPKKADELSKLESVLFLCGRYEGVDQRAIDLVVDEEISIGDYVITSGELASTVIVDAVCRFIPGVLGNDESAVNESHQDGLLEHPHYTRPEIFEGLTVPRVLLEGNHKKIEEWRHAESVKLTETRRKDLFRHYKDKL